jgi:hypothetical protein
MSRFSRNEHAARFVFAVSGMGAAMRRRWEGVMRGVLFFFVLLLSLGLWGCGEQPVVVKQPPGSTVVVPPDGQPKVCPNGSGTC